MRSILMSLSIFGFFSTVVSDDTLLFSDIGAYPSDLGSSDDLSLWTDDSSWGTNDPLSGESMFDEASPQMLSLDDCSSGDLGMAGDFGIMRKTRRGNVCRPEGSTQAPTGPDQPPDDQNSNELDSFSTFPYMPPPAFDGLGCPSLWGKIFPYTVCSSSSRGDRTPSDLLDVQLPSFTVKNAELSTIPKFAHHPSVSVYMKQVLSFCYPYWIRRRGTCTRFFCRARSTC